MPGGKYLDKKTEWKKKFILFPIKVNGEWHWLKKVYKRKLYYDTMTDYYSIAQYKLPKQFIIDELKGQNE